MDAVIILSLVKEMELMDTFVMHMCAKDTFEKHAVAHDRLVIDDIVIQILVEKMELIDAFLLILKECSQTLLIGDGCCHFTNISIKNGKKTMLLNWHL